MLRSRQERPTSGPAIPKGPGGPKGPGANPRGGPGKNWAVAVAARMARMVDLNIFKGWLVFKRLTFGLNE